MYRTRKYFLIRMLIVEQMSFNINKYIEKMCSTYFKSSIYINKAPLL